MQTLVMGGLVVIGLHEKGWNFLGTSLREMRKLIRLLVWSLRLWNWISY